MGYLPECKETTEEAYVRRRGMARHTTTTSGLPMPWTCQLQHAAASFLQGWASSSSKNTPITHSTHCNPAPASNTARRVPHRSSLRSAKQTASLLSPPFTVAPPPSAGAAPLPPPLPRPCCSLTMRKQPASQRLRVKTDLCPIADQTTGTFIAPFDLPLHYRHDGAVYSGSPSCPAHRASGSEMGHLVTRTIQEPTALKRAPQPKDDTMASLSLDDEAPENRRR
ncbi:uncharacterized protein A4U43_C01F11760 [Asparagus officinalis]|uniref:Uncharacterized protein n=1 Tax=Asparagus officinalis TaxID=4686 RepID=A0A5P1FPF5_ASPOF|nr:uncharacterized protein A4U43_C01F11760 [Asparagus officinalis]